jgi:hypothetical protein
MAIDPAKVCLWVPPGLKKFKLDLFNRIAAHIQRHGGRVVRDDERRLLDLPDDIIPIIGCHPPLKQTIADWKARDRTFIYWDRGYCRRIFATWLPRGDNGGFYRWEVNAFHMKAIRDVPDDRWKALKTEVQPWQKDGRHIVIAGPTFNYSTFHGTERWTDITIDALARVTDRPLMVRGKESKRPLAEDLKGAHALVTHGSNAGTEAVFLGCPVFVDRSCAAALVGRTELTHIDNPAYPDRQPWLNSLAYSQFDERELVDGTLWKLIE